MKKTRFEKEQKRLRQNPLFYGMTDSEVQLGIFYDMGLMSGAEFVLLRDALYNSEGFDGFAKMQEKIGASDDKEYDDEDEEMDSFEKMMYAQKHPQASKTQNNSDNEDDAEQEEIQEEMERASLSVDFENPTQIDAMQDEYLYLKDTGFFFQRFDLMAAFLSLKQIRDAYSLKNYEMGMIYFRDDAEDNFFYNCVELDSKNLISMTNEKKFLLTASSVYAAIDNLRKDNLTEDADLLQSRLSLFLTDVPEFFFEQKKENFNRLMAPIKSRNEFENHQKFLRFVSKFFKPVVLSTQTFQYLSSEKCADPLSEKEVLERLILTRDLAEEAVKKDKHWTPKHKDYFLNMLEKMAIPKPSLPIVVTSKKLKKIYHSKGHGRCDE